MTTTLRWLSCVVHVVLFHVPASAAPDNHLHGIVRDSLTHAPLQGVTVRIAGSRAGTLTDRSGTFHLHDLPDTAIVDLSFVGYHRKRLTLLLDHELRLEILLAPSGVQSRQILVEEDRGPTAGLSTQPIEILTPAEIDEHRGQTFASALTSIPGVTVMNTGPSISKPMIHGMSGTRLVTMNAGVAQEGQQWGAEHAPEIDPFTPGRIQVVKGPASVMYGPNAMGGVISVDPRPLPSDAVMNGEVNINGFTNNRQGAASVFVEGGGLFGMPLGVRVQGSGRRAGDAAAPDYRLANTGFSELNGSADVGWATDSMGILVHGSIFSTTLGIFKGSHLGNAADLERAIQRGRPAVDPPFSYDITSPRQEVRHTLMSIQGFRRIDGLGKLQLTYGWQQNTRREFDAHNTRIIGRGDDPAMRARDSIDRLNRALATPAMELLLTTMSAEASLQHRLADNVAGTIGLSGTRQVNDRSGTVFLVPDYRSYGLGGYAVESWLLDRWTLAAGLRYDYRWLMATVRNRAQQTPVEQRKTFASVSGSIGASYAVDEAWTLSANVGTGWRPPQVNELYSNDVHHGVALYEIGDSTLHAERNLAIDLTVRYALPGIDIQATVYSNVFDGYIYSLPDPANPTITVRGTFPTYRFTQAGATINGADFSATVAVAEAMSLYASATIVRGTDLDRDVPLFLMPADRGRIGAHFHLHDLWELHDPFVDVSLLGVRRQDRFISGQDYVDPPAGYGRVDASVGGHLDMFGTHLKFSVACNNLFDKRYRDYLSRFRYFADDVGRDVVIRLTIPF